MTDRFNSRDALVSVAWILLASAVLAAWYIVVNGTVVHLEVSFLPKWTTDLISTFVFGAMLVLPVRVAARLPRLQWALAIVATVLPVVWLLSGAAGIMWVWSSWLDLSTLRSADTLLGAVLMVAGAALVLVPYYMKRWPAPAENAAPEVSPRATVL